MSTRITRFHQGSKFGFSRKSRKGSVRKITLFEVGFFSYSGSFMFKGICVSKEDAVQFSL